MGTKKVAEECMQKTMQKSTIQSRKSLFQANRKETNLNCRQNRHPPFLQQGSAEHRDWGKKKEGSILYRRTKITEICYFAIKNGFKQW